MIYTFVSRGNRDHPGELGCYGAIFDAAADAFAKKEAQQGSLCSRAR